VVRNGNQPNRIPRLKSWRQWLKHRPFNFSSEIWCSSADDGPPPSLAKEMANIDNQPPCEGKQDFIMLNKIRYQLLGKEESQDDFDTPNNWKYLSTRERLRLHLAGFLATLLGVFIIWRTIVLVLWLFPSEMPMNALLGWSETRYMFVLYVLYDGTDGSGDSLSSIEYDVNGAYPDEKNPIGNPPYPGTTTSGGANWVGYLATKYNDSTILAYDYAQSGGVVQWVDGQVNQLFLPRAGQKPNYAPWSSNDSLFSMPFMFSNISDVDWNQRCHAMARYTRTVDAALSTARKTLSSWSTKLFVHHHPTVR
jgi:hypothetical protein